MNKSYRVLPAALLTAALHACASSPKATPSAASNEPPPASEVDSPEATSLAELAQRDVDAFLLRRRDADATVAQAEPQTKPATRQIIWNQDVVEPATAQTGAPGPAPSFQQSPLFLAEDDLSEQPDHQGEPEQTVLDRDRVRELIVELSKELYRDAAHADMPLRELFLIAATSLVSPDRALNADAIPGLTARERDLLREFQEFFITLGAGLDGNSDAEETINSSIDRLRLALRTEPQLKLGTVALCTRVGGFGDFDQFNRYAFLAHSEQQAVVYIEIAGFASELNQGGEWVTELSQQLVIYSERDGIPVWREDWQTAVDRTRKKRTDFFVVQVVTLPQALSVGKYHMKVRVRDEKSLAEAESSIPFEMVADPKMAATVR